MEIGWGLTLPLDDPQFWSIVFTLVMVVVARFLGMGPVQVDIEKIAPPPSFLKGEGAEGKKDRKKKEDSTTPVPAQGSSNASAPAPAPGPVKSFSKKAIEADDRFVRYLKGHQDVVNTALVSMLRVSYNTNEFYINNFRTYVVREGHLVLAQVDEYRIPRSSGSGGRYQDD